MSVRRTKRLLLILGILPIFFFTGIFATASVHAQAAVGTTTIVHGLQWDIHEMTISQVRQMAKATGFVSQAEREGGGYVYEAGWTKKSGWNWRTPFGVAGLDQEPAVHLTFDEAQSICKFFGKRLPNDREWTQAAYLEQRDSPPAGFTKGKRYTFPSGESAITSHCLSGCGNYKGTAPAGSLNRGVGPVPVMTTPMGVNGLYEMGGNVWEWVDTGPGNERITRSSSWWYGPERQHESDVATKPRDTRVVYIGFRCVRSPTSK
ncbi:MAG: formylglycine-generating enzyme family protein [Betaproteobacteria bacterium]|nr:formylglycine-generating enzyme family protein [Betaproteobacteria bacterium]